MMMMMGSKHGFVADSILHAHSESANHERVYRGWSEVVMTHEPSPKNRGHSAPLKYT